jgi:hypothetical protein
VKNAMATLFNPGAAELEEAARDVRIGATIPSARQGLQLIEYTCVLTGDRLFSSAYPHELVEDGLVYRVRGSMEDGLNTLAIEAFTLPADGELPLRVIDIVRWAGLRRVHLDKPGFVKHWQRYVGALQRHIERAGSGTGEESVAAAASAQARADQLLLRAHTFARKLQQGFDELDFLMSASEAPQGPLIVLHYTDDDPLTPYFYVLADGVVLNAAR